MISIKHKSWKAAALVWRIIWMEWKIIPVIKFMKISWHKCVGDQEFEFLSFFISIGSTMTPTIKKKARGGIEKKSETVTSYRFECKRSLVFPQTREREKENNGMAHNENSVTLVALSTRENFPLDVSIRFSQKLRRSFSLSLRGKNV